MSLVGAAAWKDTRDDSWARPERVSTRRSAQTEPVSSPARAFNQERREDMSTRHEFFKKRLAEMGLYDEGSDYDGLIGKWVEELSDLFAKQRHSGGSASSTLGVFNQLMGEYGKN